MCLNWVGEWRVASVRIAAEVKQEKRLFLLWAPHDWLDVLRLSAGLVRCLGFHLRRSRNGCRWLKLKIEAVIVVSRPFSFPALWWQGTLELAPLICFLFSVGGIYYTVALTSRVNNSTCKTQFCRHYPYTWRHTISFFFVFCNLGRGCLFLFFSFFRLSMCSISRYDTAPTNFFGLVRLMFYFSCWNIIYLHIMRLEHYPIFHRVP